ncbi:hypothetical protein HPULCUR_001979 [Helicostylum pulchrum]|uniref:Uncharacterized protein n=1 Tax=Helicostylum pulchrum TaxID=562976 RepID=A0ABP9XPD2_9FUNG
MVIRKGNVNKELQYRSVNCNTNEKEKVRSEEESIFTICSSTRIKKLLNTARHTTEYLDNDVSKSVCQEQQDSNSTPIQQEQEELQSPITFKSLNNHPKLECLCEKFSEDGHLDFMKHKI